MSSLYCQVERPISGQFSGRLDSRVMSAYHKRMVDEAEPNGVVRDAKGRFAPGTRPTYTPHNGGRTATDWTWRKLIREGLAADPQRRARILAALYAKAEDGDVRAIDTILNRCDGLPRQEIDATLHAGPSVEAVLMAMAEARLRLGGAQDV